MDGAEHAQGNDEATQGAAEVHDLSGYGHVIDREKRRLKVPLTAEEVRAASRRMGAKMRHRRQLEEEFEAAKETHKGHLKTLEAEIEILGVVLDTETEQREVDCVTRINWAAGTAETLRCDTDEKIAERPLTAAERQEEMFRQNPGAKRRARRDRGAE